MKPERTPICKKARAPLPPTVDRKAEKDPVEVFCRIRPLEQQDPYEDGPCINRASPTTIQFLPPEKFITRNANLKEQFYRFSHVFHPNVSQTEIFDSVAKPLVSDLLAGKNGLLFAYGITGSGKTYTMEGRSKEPGIFRRTIDVIFKSVGKCQTRKYVFKSDKMNGFDCQSEAEAMYDRQKVELLQLGRLTRSNMRRKDTSSGSQESLHSISDASVFPSVDDDNGYAIFVTYIQIYNKYVYDLLEDSRKPQSKVLREDARRNMYIHGCTEMEVKNPQEAYEILLKGQKRKKVASTILNPESSRSHSVFTIRVVQAPLDALGEEVIKDKQSISISQLSLVDLAGSERTYKTKATGDRLKESGDINNSLMALRQCIETLRENQSLAKPKMVPYRDCKLTYYFKNFLEGEGKVRMIVCVNPKASDYEETLHVMKFAEVASEVQIHRQTPGRMPIPGLTPGRRRANLMMKDVQQRFIEKGIDTKDLVTDLTPIYTLGPPWPLVSFTQDTFDEVVQKLQPFLLKRIECREKRKADIQDLVQHVRNRIATSDNDADILKKENLSLIAQNEEAMRRVKAYENMLRNAEAANDSLYSKFTDYTSLQESYNQACEERDLAITQGQIEKQRLKTKLKIKLEEERELMSKDLHHKLKAQKKLLKTEMCAFLDDRPPIRSKPLLLAATPNKIKHGLEPTCTPMMGQKAYAMRHRRSMSEGADGVWIDQKPIQANALTTVGGSTQVVFSDIEILRQRELLTPFKRGSDGTPKVDSATIQDRYGQAVTGQTPKPTNSVNKRFRKDL